MSEDESKDDKTSGSDAMTDRLLKARQILICEAIDQKMAARVINHLLALAQDSDDDITLFLNSQGGHVEAGDSIHDMIKFIKPRVKIVGTGWVASAGTHIYLAAPKEDRVCLPNTRFLIHQPSGGVGGKVTDIAIQAEQIEIMRKRLAQIISDATGQPFDKVMQDIDRDHWMNTDEAKAYGILDRVITSVDDLT
ncbi:ATP-dependent Clp protease proteolytic subunit [Marivita sp. S6314]|uniref:ATP-dependent Clp protease proteolytic subunit n=1 Tax=Marivita sp. S6314 TaxID=2926406 RepID=UPI001FF0EE12|nr:ATP-dependent Clp protease proteolytic subunit [Marivita sp. S6314]MCK0150370.1 ATP-dependent Clp protease proteolytic subunit [Marivita sp. S6314]